MTPDAEILALLQEIAARLATLEALMKQIAYGMGLRPE